MITNFFIPELNNHDVQELWFQQDGATCHTARATIDLLKDTKSGKKKISLQEALDLLENLPSEISVVLTDDFSDEERNSRK
ncbi:hypothetical protein TNCV_2341731 [Trichonephila clavipes]|uniref:Uncharacterized protein n=1 Tax=Trichonephila clavipes TaxID=2585209 RepID=A0A8X6R4U4_TRICX|nr:hypothetical protein TNCV_2341731 [Trichonephila clavipes]